MAIRMYKWRKNLILPILLCHSVPFVNFDANVCEGKKLNTKPIQIFLPTDSCSSSSTSCNSLTGFTVFQNYISRKLSGYSIFCITHLPFFTLVCTTCLFCTLTCVFTLIFFYQGINLIHHFLLNQLIYYFNGVYHLAAYILKRGT